MVYGSWGPGRAAALRLMNADIYVGPPALSGDGPHKSGRFGTPFFGPVRLR